jgi:hypothetical protein
VGAVNHSSIHALKVIDLPEVLAQAIAETQTSHGMYDVCGKTKKIAMGLGWQMPMLAGQQPMYYKNGAASSSTPVALSAERGPRAQGFSPARQPFSRDHKGLRYI